MSTKSIDAGLLLLRVGAAGFLLAVHGLPKLLNFSHELTVIDDPLGLGRGVTLILTLGAEIVAPVLIALGIVTRLACLPILFLLLVSLLLVHPEWSVGEGQFAWYLLLMFVTLTLTGPGAFALGGRATRWWWQ